jgi:hypothetical protein
VIGAPPSSGATLFGSLPVIHTIFDYSSFSSVALLGADPKNGSDSVELACSLLRPKSRLQACSTESDPPTIRRQTPFSERLSGEQFLDHVARNIGEPVVSAAVKVS